MKYPVYPSRRGQEVPEGAAAIHLVRPLPAAHLRALLERRHSIQLVEMSQSTRARLSSAARAVLCERGVITHTVYAPGRAIEIPLEKIRQVMEMRQDQRPLREIARVTGVPKSTVHYLLRYAQRAKVKNGARVVHLR